MLTGTKRLPSSINCVAIIHAISFHYSLTGEMSPWLERGECLALCVTKRWLWPLPYTHKLRYFLSFPVALQGSQMPEITDIVCLFHRSKKYIANITCSNSQHVASKSQSTITFRQRTVQVKKYKWIVLFFKTFIIT